MVLPTWDEIDKKRERKEELSPIEQFIYDEAPMETDDPTFMGRLNAALDYAVRQHQSRDSAMVQCLQYYKGESCCVGFDLACTDKPCMLPPPQRQ